MDKKTKFFFFLLVIAAVISVILIYRRAFHTQNYEIIPIPAENLEIE